MEQTQFSAEEYLQHHQVKGGQWGVMHGPPYPLDKSKSTGSSLKKGVKAKSVNEDKKAKSSGGIKGILAKAKANKVAKQRQAARVEALKKARDAKSAKEKEAKDKAELKQKVINSRSASMLYKHADLFSTEELREMKNRLQVEQEVKSMSPDLVDKGKKYINTASTVSEMLNKTANTLENGTRTYNSVAKILNSMTNSNLPYIKDPFRNDGNKDNKNNQKPTSEKYMKYDAEGNLRFSKTTTDDGNGNKKIIEQEHNKKKK